MASLLSIPLLVAFTLLLSSSFAESGRKESKDKELNQESIIQLGHSFRKNRIAPSQVVQLSWQPRVFLYRSLLSDEECDHLISLARQSKKNQLEKGDDSWNIAAKTLHSITETPLDIEDDILASIDERISTWTLLPKDYSKPLLVSRYRLEEAKHQYYYFSNQSTLDVGQPLMATAILYLSNVTQGGNIFFPKTKSHPSIKVRSDCTVTPNELRPVKGNAILFFNVRPNATPDGSSSHARCPVLKGELWYGVKFYYIRAINKENGRLGSAENECSDEDENCRRWAALGECQRNPVYMIGSPDYYGTCRKSCNAC